MLLYPQSMKKIKHYNLPQGERRKGRKEGERKKVREGEKGDIF